MTNQAHAHMWWGRREGGVAMYPTWLRWTAQDPKDTLGLSGPASLVQRTRSAGVVRLATNQGRIPVIAVQAGTRDEWPGSGYQRSFATSASRLDAGCKSLSIIPRRNRQTLSEVVSEHLNASESHLCCDLLHGKRRALQ